MEPDRPERRGALRRAQLTASRRLASLAAFWGTGRLLAAALAAVSVTAAGLWLVSPQRPPVEAAIPLTSTPDVVPEPMITVHVAGAVIRPGVYSLVAGSRVHTAIEAAGGARPDADPDRVNLAAPLIDGAQVRLPALGEPAMPDELDGGPVNLNLADTSRLESLPGIGPTLARAIVDERDRGGPFAQVDDLVRVPGLGPVRIESLRDLVAT